MVAGIAARPLAHRQLVLDDPGEEPGSDASGPFASHAVTGASMILMAATVGADIVDPDHAHTVERRPTPSRRASPQGGRRTGAGAPPAGEASGPRKDLRLVPTSDGPSRGDQLVEAPEQLQVVLRRLGEADARVDPDLAHPAVAALGGLLHEKAADLADDVVVVGVAPAWSAGRRACAWRPSRRRRRRRRARARRRRR